MNNKGKLLRTREDLLQLSGRGLHVPIPLEKQSQRGYVICKIRRRQKFFETVLQLRYNSTLTKVNSFRCDQAEYRPYIFIGDYS